MKKKKKSKKAAFDLEAFEKELEDASKPAAADGDEDDGGDGPAPAIDYDEEDLGEDVFAAPSAGAGGDSTVAGDAVETWHGTDRDYTYAEVRANGLSHYGHLLISLTAIASWPNYANIARAEPRIIISRWAETIYYRPAIGTS